jgi:HD-GYP domain-containing protein (c-di-GMP phosphodiesterase class II)
MPEEHFFMSEDELVSTHARSHGEDGSTFDLIVAACDRIRTSSVDEKVKRETGTIEKLARELHELAAKTEILAGSALRLVESDLPLMALENVINDAKTMVGADRGHILIWIPGQSMFDRVRSNPGGNPMSSLELHVADTLGSIAYESNCPILNPDIRRDAHFSSIPGIDEYPDLSIIVVPLTVDVDGATERIGIIYLDSPKDSKVFNETDAWLMQSFGSLTALTIRNIRLTSTLRLAYQDTIHALVKTLEAKDPYTKGHSERVAEYAERCGKRMELGIRRLEVLYSAGLLHDIGKIGVRDAILNKPSTLTIDEYAHVKRHPEISEAILAGLNFLIDESDILSQHHERYDGKGYPRGLKGDQISIEGAIIQVADAWDAMTSRRVYRSEFNVDDALTELTRNAGTQFNPEVVGVFVRMIQEEGILPLEFFDGSNETS